MNRLNKGKKLQQIFCMLFFIPGLFLQGNPVIPNRLSVSQQEQSITERIREELENAIQQEGVIPEQFQVLGMHQSIESDDWPEGWCLEIEYVNADLPTGEICFYQDGRQGTSEYTRLDYYDFGSWDPYMGEVPIGQHGRIFHFPTPGVDDENDRGEYHGAFVKDAWIGDFLLPALPFGDGHSPYYDLINNILYALPSSFVENPDSLYPTQFQHVFTGTLMDHNDQLPEGYWFNGGSFNYESWAGAEMVQCFLLSTENEVEANLCVFRDNAFSQTAEIRMQQVKDSNNWFGEEIEKDMLDEANGSILIRDYNDPYTYLLFFAFNNWVGFVMFHVPGYEPFTEDLIAIGQTSIESLKTIPEDFPMEKTELVFGDILEGTWYSEDLPDGYRIGPLHRHNGTRTSHQFVYYEGNEYPVGDIYYTQETGYFTGHFSSPLEGYSNYSKKYSGTGLILEDRDALVFTGSDGVFRQSLFYNLHIDGLLAFIRLNEEDDPEILAQIGRAIGNEIKLSKTKDFPVIDSQTEEEIWQCFPEDDQNPLADYMPAYVRSIQYNSTAYIYQISFLAPNYPLEDSTVSLKVFNLPPSRVNIFDNGARLDSPQQIGENLYFSFSKPNASDNDIQFELISYFSNKAVRIGTKVPDWSYQGKEFHDTWLKDSENTFVRDAYVQISEQMEACMSEFTELTPISVPGEISQEALDDSFIRAVYIQGNESIWQSQENYDPQVAADMTHIDKTDWGSGGIHLDLWFSRQLTAPLTYAIYDPKYDFVMFLQQNKYTLPGNRINTGFPIDRQILFEGENILLIWMGEELIGYYPFYVFYNDQIH